MVRKLFAGLALVTICSGCAQILRLDGTAFYNAARCERDHESPYKCTKESYTGWFCAPSRAYGWNGSQSYDPIGDAWLTLLWPVSVIDLPCEAVIDTVMCVPDWLLQR